MLAEAALARGLHSFGASYLAENRPILAHTGSIKRFIEHGVAQAAVNIERDRLAAAEHDMNG
jgi:hypothetical protein